ncbi:MAG: alanine racemase [bacterium]
MSDCLQFKHSDSKSRAWLELDYDALKHNYEQIKSLTRSEVMCVVKANAYGHGLVSVFKALRQAESFAVATLEEAIALREAGCKQTILLLEGVNNAIELDLASQHGLDVVFHRKEQLALFKKFAGLPIVVWIKVDTGMHRLGIDSSDFSFCFNELSQTKSISRCLLMSHIACADDRDDPANEQQFKLFKSLAYRFEGRKSLANSATTLNFPEQHYDVVRTGAALYGISSVLHRSVTDYSLKAVLSLKARLIAVHPVSAGERVGYGGDWRATKDTSIGVISIGYGDGYPRSVKAGAPVKVGTNVYPLVGRVSMDMLTVDLGSQCQESIGCEVELWGKSISVDEVAKYAGTIGYELALQLTERVKHSS